jgi:hypothetical protein
MGLCQETSKYVENQMNVVGTNVKKICAELIQDLLPPTEKKFDCPIHGKCDCITAEKPKQKAYYTCTKGSDTEWRGEDIDVQGIFPNVFFSKYVYLFVIGLLRAFAHFLSKENFIDMW